MYRELLADFEKAASTANEDTLERIALEIIEVLKEAETASPEVLDRARKVIQDGSSLPHNYNLGLGKPKGMAHLPPGSELAKKRAKDIIFSNDGLPDRGGKRV